MFWWLTIGFIVVWVIAVIIEIVWFSTPDEEEEDGTAPAMGPSEAVPDGCKASCSCNHESGLPLNANVAK